MPEHDGNDPVDPTDPFDELEPIDLAALFGDELDDEPDDSDVELDDAVGEPDGAVGEPNEADALLMAQLFAADLADEPASRFSVADLLAVARPAAGVGADATAAAPTREWSVADPAARRARDAAMDELARRRRRRSWMSRGLLAAAAVAVLGIGATAALNSQGGSDTGSASSAELDAGGAATRSGQQAYSAAGSSIQQGVPEAAPESSGAVAPAPSAPSSGGSAATVKSMTDSAGGGSGSVPDQGGTESRSSAASTSGASGTSSTSGSTSAAAAPTVAQCQLPWLSDAAVAAVVGVLGRPSSSQLQVATDSVGACRAQALSGQVFVTGDGSRLTVLVARDFDAELNAGGPTSSSGAAVRSAELRSGGSRVLVTTPAGSSVTDRQLTQVATAVLGTQR